ncbi:cell adhesion molecule CEACAM19 isoform X1 [Equus caballus]|uniref:cell adhesion molecule CEACAM19 isoform X1 n=1 Tax=Equus caballus TaxID=9796 RepID=UPI0038B2A6ED
MLDKVARVGPACPVGVAQPDAARTVVLITAVATASHPSGKERLRESRKPQGVHSHPGKLVQPVSESVPGSTGEAREPVESGRWGSAGLGHVSKGPPRFPLSWPTADSQGPALGPPPCPAGDPLVSPQDAKMETPVGAQCCFSKGLLLSASILVLWAPQGSWAALHIQKIPEHPQKNQDLLLSVQGVPETFQDFNWYLGEDAYGGTRLFTYIPGLQRPQRDGSAMGQRDIVGFPNGSMLLRRIQPGDSGTYQVAVTVNPAWTMRAKTEVQVAEKHQELPITQLPMSAGIMAAIIIGSLAAGSLFIGIIAYILVTRGWRSQSHRKESSFHLQCNSFRWVSGFSSCHHSLSLFSSRRDPVKISQLRSLRGKGTVLTVDTRPGSVYCPLHLPDLTSSHSPPHTLRLSHTPLLAIPTPASGPLHRLFPLSGILFHDFCTAGPLGCFWPLLEHHLPGDARINIPSFIRILSVSPQ